MADTKPVTRTPQEAYNYTMAKIYDLEAKVKELETLVTLVNQLVVAVGNAKG